MIMQKNAALRRSRRAASLTAQVLWNIQIEEDSKSGKPQDSSATVQKVPNSKKEDGVPEAKPEDKIKRGRKRSVSAESSSSGSQSNPASTTVTAKKKKISPGCSGHIFPVTKPLQVGKLKTSGKLTASVAPLMKSQPILPKPPAPATTLASTPASHVSPILLLPVSLQANQGGSPGAGGSVGGLSLVTLQASQDLFNCFGLSKTIVDTSQARKQWNAVNVKTTQSCTAPIGVNTNTGRSVFASITKQQFQAHTGFDKSQTLQVGLGSQNEPLNLKMGETTVPSLSTKKIAHIRPVTTQTINYPRSSEKQLLKIPASGPKKFQGNNASTKSSQSLKTVLIKIKPNRRKNKAIPIFHSYKQSQSLLTCGKKSVKCPSPDYACSSPDVDDVHRDPRHSCNRRHINLRQKAAPPPGTLAYEESVEVQKRILAEIKRSQKAKAKAKAIAAAKKPKISFKISNDNRPVVASEPHKFKSLEESNNGWKWVGKPYSALAFSVANGKYVQRRCYPGMTRTDEDGTSFVLVRDCVFLLAGDADELPYIAKVSALWEKPNCKEMMLSLVWYYRPEHTEGPKLQNISEDELLMSRHQDEISVACVEERCKVLTYVQFCRAQARLRRDGFWRKTDIRRIVPRAKPAYFKRPFLPGESLLDAEDMFFSRQLYDAVQRKVRAKLPLPSSLWNEHRLRNALPSA